MIWEPFLLALVLGLIMSAGLYFAYLWPSVEPLDEEPPAVVAKPEPEAAVAHSADLPAGAPAVAEGDKGEASS